MMHPETDSPEAPVTVLLCGVGGQGTILAADLLARTAMAAGCEVKLSEIHGMAQRGGAVTTVVRFGASVASMVADRGEVDNIIAFETTEALRNLSYLKQGGILLSSDESIAPLPVLTGRASMPKNPQEQLESAGARLIPANRLALEAGTVKCSNVVLLGTLAKFLDFDKALWEEQITHHVPPKTVETNLAAFRSGYAYLEGE